MFAFLPGYRVQRKLRGGEYADADADNGAIPCTCGLKWEVARATERDAA